MIQFQVSIPISFYKDKFDPNSELFFVYIERDDKYNISLVIKYLLKNTDLPFLPYTIDISHKYVYVKDKKVYFNIKLDCVDSEVLKPFKQFNNKDIELPT